MTTNDQKMAEEMLKQARSAKAHPLLAENKKTPAEIQAALNKMLEISSRLIQKLK